MPPSRPPQIDWDSVPDASASANTGIDWDSVPSAVTGEISPVAPPKDAQESVQRWFGDLSEDVKHGSGRTLPGRILRGMGAPGTEAGAGGGPNGVGNIMGGEVLGPAEIGHALSSTRPEDTTQQRVQQANELFRGVGHAGALPAAAFGGPELLPSLGIYGTAGSGVSHAASAIGANPEEAELAGNVAMTAAPLVKYPVGPVIGRGLQKASGPLGKAVGYGAAAAELYHTRNPLSLIFGHPRATRAATGLIDMAGRGLQYFGGPPELGPLPPAMRMPNVEAQDAQTFGKNVMGMKLPGPGEVKTAEPLRLGKGPLITPPPAEAMPGSMEGRPSTTPPTPKPKGRARQMSNLPPYYGEPQAPPPVYTPEAQQETIHPQEESVKPLITTWGAPSTTPKALSEAVPPVGAPPEPPEPVAPEAAPLINTQPLTKEPEKPIISQEAKPDMPETPPPGNISRRGLFGMIRGGKAQEAPPEPAPVETGPDHDAMMGVAQQAIQKLYPDNPDQMMNAHVEDQNLQGGKWDAHDLLTDVLHGYMDAIARTDPESTVRQHMIWTLKKSLPLFEQAGAMGDPESAKAYSEILPTPEKLDEYFKNINEPPPGPRPVGRVPKNYPDEPGLIGPQSQETPSGNLGTAITQAVNKPVSRRDFLQKGAKAAASTMVPKGVAGNLIQTALSGQLPTSVPQAAKTLAPVGSLPDNPAAVLEIARRLHQYLHGKDVDPNDHSVSYVDSETPLGYQPREADESPMEYIEALLDEYQDIGYADAENNGQNLSLDKLNKLKGTVPFIKEALQYNSPDLSRFADFFSNLSPENFQKVWENNAARLAGEAEPTEEGEAETGEEGEAEEPVAEEPKIAPSTGPGGAVTEIPPVSEPKTVDREDQLSDKGFQEQGRESIEQGEEGAADLRKSHKNPDELFPWAQHPYGSYEPPEPPNVPEPEKPKPLVDTKPIESKKAKKPSIIAQLKNSVNEKPLIETGKASLSAPKSTTSLINTGGSSEPPEEHYYPPFEEGPEEKTTGMPRGIGDAVDELIKDTSAPKNDIFDRNQRYAKEGSYTTKLSKPQEEKFQQWVKDNNIPWRDEPNADYDMRGFWKAQQGGDPNAKQAKNLHFPDTYKTPYHKTFSNESQYATPDAPRWVGNKLIDNSRQVIADESGGKANKLPETQHRQEAQKLLDEFEGQDPKEMYEYAKDNIRPLLTRTDERGRVLDEDEWDTFIRVLRDESRKKHR